MQKNYSQAQMWTVLRLEASELVLVTWDRQGRLENCRDPKMVCKLVFTNSFFVRGSRLSSSRGLTCKFKLYNLKIFANFLFIKFLSWV